MEDICFFFQCKIEFYFIDWTPIEVFAREAVAMSENTSFRVHEWKKNSICTEKNQIVFFYAFIHSN